MAKNNLLNIVIACGAWSCLVLVPGACSDNTASEDNSTDTSDSENGDSGTDTTANNSTDTPVDSTTSEETKDTATVMSTDNDTGSISDTGKEEIDTDVTAECAVKGDNKTTLVFTNKCDDVLTFEGSGIDAGNLQPGQSECRHLGSADEPISSIRYWGYIGPNPGGEHHTLAEMTLNTDFYDFDWYNISHVDAHNLPMAIVPLEMPDCRSLVCATSLLENCPDEGKFYLDSTLVSCVSPDRDNKDSVVAQYFESECSDAYSWSGDDAESMAACAGEDYAIVFCP